jgi:hypothetical protein
MHGATDAPTAVRVDEAAAGSDDGIDDAGHVVRLRFRDGEVVLRFPRTRTHAAHPRLAATVREAWAIL